MRLKELIQVPGRNVTQPERESLMAWLKRYWRQDKPYTKHICMSGRIIQITEETHGPR